MSWGILTKCTIEYPTRLGREGGGKVLCTFVCTVACIVRSQSRARKECLIPGGAELVYPMGMVL